MEQSIGLALLRGFNANHVERDAIDHLNIFTSLYANCEISLSSSLLQLMHNLDS